MNAPTPETDVILTHINGDIYSDEQFEKIKNLVSKLERERDEARVARDIQGKVAIDVIAERDQMRKIADELAFHLACTHKETGCQSQCSTVVVLNNYNSLPHVIAQKGNKV